MLAAVATDGVGRCEGEQQVGVQPGDVVGCEAANPVVRRRRLGLELRALREATGMSGEDAAKQLGWSTSKLSRIEIGRNPPKPADLIKLLDLCGVTDQVQRDELGVLLREAKRKGWWQLYSDIPYSTFIGLEAEAASMLTYEQVIPGLFQTEDYARAIIAGTIPAVDPDVLEERVEVRLTRQGVLTKERPIEVRAVLDEVCVRRVVGGPDVMRGQISRLLTLARLPNVIIQVLPFSVGAHPGTMMGPSLSCDSRTQGTLESFMSKATVIRILIVRVTLSAARSPSTTCGRWR
jgi:transcriptional regulator with XRE-family HTH domain